MNQISIQRDTMAQLICHSKDIQNGTECGAIGGGINQFVAKLIEWVKIEMAMLSISQ